MTLYVDTSALLKLYVEEAESAACEALLDAEPDVATARHTVVEARRGLAMLLSGLELSAARETFELDWARFRVVELEAELCEAAAAIAERTGVRTLDALHVAAATTEQAPGGDLRRAAGQRRAGPGSRGHRPARRPAVAHRSQGASATRRARVRSRGDEAAALTRGRW